MSTTTLAEDVGFRAADARVIAELAFQLVDAGDLDQAVVLFEGLLTLNPRDASVRAALGAVLQSAGRIAEAEAHYDEALRTEPGTVLALVNRGALKLSRGDHTGRRDLEEASRVPGTLQPRATRLLAAIKAV